MNEMIYVLTNDWDSKKLIMKITLKAAFQKDDTMRIGFIEGRYRNISKLTKKHQKDI